MENTGVSVMKLPSQLLTQEDIDRINNMFAVPRSKKETKERGKKDYVKRSLRIISTTPALLCPIISKKFYNTCTSFVNPRNIRQDESCMGFKPTLSTENVQAVGLFRETITIGYSSSEDVNLSLFGYCEYVSSLHAIIVVNKRAGFYELQNKAPYGTYINNTLFGKADFDLDKENTKQVNGFEHRQTRCKCIENTNFKICDRQGPIRIGHGFVISFGCISFVFSVLGNK